MMSRNRIVGTDLKELQLALGVYKAQNGEYPKANIVVKTYTDNYDVTLQGALVPDYIAKLPDATKAPNANCDYGYITDSDGTWYKLTAKNCIYATNQTEGTQVDDSLARCPSTCAVSATCPDPTTNGFYQSIAVYSNGGQCE